MRRLDVDVLVRRDIDPSFAVFTARADKCVNSTAPYPNSYGELASLLTLLMSRSFLEVCQFATGLERANTSQIDLSVT